MGEAPTVEMAGRETLGEHMRIEPHLVPSLTTPSVSTDEVPKTYMLPDRFSHNPERQSVKLLVQRFVRASKRVGARLLGRHLAESARVAELFTGWRAIPAAVLAIYIAIGLVGPMAWTYSPDIGSGVDRNSPPLSWSKRNFEQHADWLPREQRAPAYYWLGTDHVGRDLFTRYVRAARNSVLLAIPATFIGLSVGGAIAWFWRPRTNPTVLKWVSVGVAAASIPLCNLLSTSIELYLLDPMVAAGFSFYSASLIIVASTSTVAAFVAILYLREVSKRSKSDGSPSIDEHGETRMRPFWLFAAAPVVMLCGSYVAELNMARDLTLSYFTELHEAFTIARFGDHFATATVIVFIMFAAHIAWSVLAIRNATKIKSLYR